MYQQKKIVYLHCETPLHAGSGSDLGIVDLPIQRERATGFPKIEASSLKGAVRQHFHYLAGDDEHKLKNINRIFGPAPDSPDANKTAGCVAFTDATLLCMPVRSAAGVFAWVTCPSVLRRWYRDAGIVDESVPDVDKGQARVRVLSSTSLIPKDTSFITLEEYTFKAEKIEQPLGSFYTLAKAVFASGGLFEKLINDLVILSDQDYSFFVENATEVITRIRISQETGTVDQGALWTEEYLPMESILYANVLTSGEFVTKEHKGERLSAEKAMNDIYTQLNGQPRFQLGGNATLGKGHLKATISELIK